MDALTTPADRFEGLPAFPWPARRWVGDATRGLAIAYLDEGPADADRVFLCLHGNPSWGYLYRKMVPVFLASGARVVAPDLIGFGRSDKPVLDVDHSFDFHRDALLRVRRRARPAPRDAGRAGLGRPVRADAADGDARAVRSPAADEHRVRDRRGDRRLSRLANVLEQPARSRRRRAVPSERADAERRRDRGLRRAVSRTRATRPRCAPFRTSCRTARTRPAPPCRAQRRRGSAPRGAARASWRSA